MKIITYMSTKRESFEGQNSGPPSEARPASEGGSGVPPPEIFKNLYCKWCYLRYFYAYHFACAGANANEIDAKTLLRKLALV